MYSVCCIVCLYSGVISLHFLQEPVSAGASELSSWQLLAVTISLYSRERGGREGERGREEEREGEREMGERKRERGEREIEREREREVS